MKYYYMADRGDLVGFLGQAECYAAALDVGCASGGLGVLLAESGAAATVDGVELNADAAQVAGKILRRVWQGTVEQVLDEIAWDTYDLIVMADVLEHLTEPWAILRFLHERCRPGCRLLLSVPNVRHHGVVLPLIFKGKFEYQDSGIMDRTHLHFFTRSSLLDSVKDAGWQMCRMAPNIKRKYRKWWYPYRLLEEFLAVQYFVLAEK